ncbi:MAG: hypothetical protein M3O68_00955 [Thermoproteota archaeon]|nr:hypothetical protein [Thermoproteota archaeon]
MLNCGRAGNIESNHSISSKYQICLIAVSTLNVLATERNAAAESTDILTCISLLLPNHPIK